METKKRYRSDRMLQKILPVQIISYCIVFLHSFIDSFFVGNFIGTDMLAVLSFALPISLFVLMLGNLISTGCQIICGELIGKGMVKETNKFFSAGFFLVLLSSFVSTVLIFAFASPAAHILGAEGEIASALVSYLKMISIGFFFLENYKFFMPFIQLENHPNIAMWVTLLMLISKFIFNLAAVFVFKNGMVGIGLSTAFSYIVTFIFSLIYYFSKKTKLKLDIKSVGVSDMFEIVKVGSPNAVLDGCMTARSWLFNSAAFAVGGVELVSAYSIACNVTEVMYAGLNGTGSTALLLSSVFLGDENKAEFDHLYKKSIMIGSVINAAVFLSALIFAAPLAEIFGAEGIVKNSAAFGIRFFMSAALVNAIPVITLNFYKSLKKRAKVNLIYLTEFFVIPLIVLNLFPIAFGEAGIWCCYLVADSAILIFLLKDFIHFSKTGELR